MHHHHHSDYVEVVSAKGPQKLSGTTRAWFIAMIIVGFGAFAFNAFFVENSRIGWIAFLHNFYFFTGLSAAGVVIATIIHITNAMWGRPIKRYAEAMGAFLPYSILFFVILVIGAYTTAPGGFIYEWIEKEPDAALFPNKNFWLQPEFVFGRVFFYLIGLTLAARAFVNTSVRADMGLAHEHNSDWPQPSGWKGVDAERDASQKKQGFWSAVYCLVYAFFISMLAYDLIMSLDFRWISTMFGGWNFTTFMLIGWGSLVLITNMVSKRFGLEKYMHKKMYHDLGKLTFGFTVVWGYLSFAQLMVIWYGNLAHETGYLITRYEHFRPLVITVVSMVFVIPFILGLSKNRKMSPYSFGPVVLISFVGVWLERLLLIGPSAWYFDRNAGDFLPGFTGLVIWDAIVFLGFFGVFALVFCNWLYKRPLMVISDPRLDEGINRH